MPVGGKLDAVIWEAALITTVGSDEVQRGQLDRLLELMDRPNISVQVLPLEAGDKASMSGSFVMFSFGRERGGRQDPQWQGCGARLQEPRCRGAELQPGRVASLRCEGSDHGL